MDASAVSTYVEENRNTGRCDSDCEEKTSCKKAEDAGDCDEAGPGKEGFVSANAPSGTRPKTKIMRMITVSRTMPMDSDADPSKPQLTAPISSTDQKLDVKREEVSWVTGEDGKNEVGVGVSSGRTAEEG